MPTTVALLSAASDPMTTNLMTEFELVPESVVDSSGSEFGYSYPPYDDSDESYCAQGDFYDCQDESEW